jgi:hypothetical protein
MNSFDNNWQRLVSAARRASPDADEAAPYGFSTRVVALAFERAQPSPSAVARLSLRAAFIACALAVAAVAANYSVIRGAFEDSPSAAASDDPVAEVVDLGT